MTTLTRRDKTPAPTTAPHRAGAHPARRVGRPLYIALAGVLALVSGAGYRLGEAYTGRPGIAATLMHPLAWRLVKLGTALLVMAAVCWLLRRIRSRA